MEIRHTLTMLTSNISLFFIFMFIFSQDMEDSVVCGGAAWSGCVYGEHVPAGTGARPRTA